jgi:tRNA-dihydrouridine synthase B
MGCQSNNATAPMPAIAPGAEGLDPRRIAERLALRHGGGGVSPRIPGLVGGFDAPFFQAGLAGYSDAAMRIIARRHGCPFCVTEALLDRTILAGGRGFAKADLGELHDNVPGGAEDHPLAGQLMGSDPAEMAAAAVKMVEQAVRPDREYRELAGACQHQGGAVRGRDGETERRRDGVGGACQHRDREGAATAVARPSGRSLKAPTASFQAIDVNLACPVRKIAGKARGGHWLAHPEGAIRILEAVREAVPPRIPVTVKLRRAFDDTPEMAGNFRRILDAAYDIGYAWATVHARTVEQKYIGPSRWDLLREVVREARWRGPERIIFGSGDVWTAGDIFRMIAFAGVDAVSVARGCIGNPWIFRQGRDLLAGREPGPPTMDEQRAVLEAHFRLALSVNARVRRAEVYTGRVMRKFAIRFAEHHPEAERVRRRFIAVSSLEDWRAVLDEFYAGGAVSV